MRNNGLTKTQLSTLEWYWTEFLQGRLMWNTFLSRPDVFLFMFRVLNFTSYPQTSSNVLSLYFASLAPYICRHFSWSLHPNICSLNSLSPNRSNFARDITQEHSLTPPNQCTNTERDAIPTLSFVPVTGTFKHVPEHTNVLRILEKPQNRDVYTYRNPGLKMYKHLMFPDAHCRASFNPRWELLSITW